MYYIAADTSRVDRKKCRKYKEWRFGVVTVAISGWRKMRCGFSFGFFSSVSFLLFCRCTGRVRAGICIITKSAFLASGRRKNNTIMLQYIILYYTHFRHRVLIIEHIHIHTHLYITHTYTHVRIIYAIHTHKYTQIHLLYSYTYTNYHWDVVGGAVNFIHHIRVLDGLTTMDVHGLCTGKSIMTETKPTETRRRRYYIHEFVQVGPEILI